MNGIETAKRIYELCSQADIRPFLRFFEDGFQGTCVILRLLREADGQMTAGQIAKNLGVSTARVASALNSMEKKGWAQRQKSAADGRMVVVRLTPAGREILADHESRLLSVIGDYLDKLTEQERLGLFKVMEKLVKN